MRVGLSPGSLSTIKMTIGKASQPSSAAQFPALFKRDKECSCHLKLCKLTIEKASIPESPDLTPDGILEDLSCGECPCSGIYQSPLPPPSNISVALHPEAQPNPLLEASLARLEICP